MDAQWQVHTFDLDAYLERVGGPVTAHADPDPSTLALLHRAHVARVPFENVDVILGRPISVDLVDVQAKLVGARRGGYCYEHGLVFAAALERLGYGVDRLLARVGRTADRPGPRTHMILRVTDSHGDHWLADVGFGSGLLRPLPLEHGATARQGAWTYRLLADDSGWQLQADEAGRWAVQYGFDTQRQHLADIEMSNHFTQTWPTSPFRQRVVVVRKDETAVHRLLGRQLSVSRPGRPDDTRTISEEELPATLAQLGLPLPDDLVRALRSAPTAEPVTDR